jgi:hypothetical protein
MCASAGGTTSVSIVSRENQSRPELAVWKS